MGIEGKEAEAIERHKEDVDREVQYGVYGQVNLIKWRVKTNMYQVSTGWVNKAKNSV